MENDGILWRTAADIGTDGRTLIGLAIPWATPVLVRDPGKPPYWEAFARSAFDETLRRNPEPRPLFKSHGHRNGDDPIGVVSFERTERGLRFLGHISRTTAGDEALELVSDGAMRSTSVAFVPLKDRRMAMAQGNVTLRTEVALREMSIAPTGFGQYPQAKVEAVRTELDGDQHLSSRLVVPPAADQLLRMRARRPLLAPKTVDSPAEGTSERLASLQDVEGNEQNNVNNEEQD